MAEIDFSVLEKVKKRLQGPLDVEDSPTQIIDDATQVILKPDTQNLDDTQRVEETQQPNDTEIDFGQSMLFAQPTQKIQVPLKVQQTQAIKLPQLGLEDVEVLKPDASTQVIPPRQQAEELEADLTKTSLTDEENEIAADNAETTMDSSIQKTVTTKTELEEIQKQLSEEKRARSIKPAFEKRQIDPVNRLVAAFESDSEDEPAKVLSDHALPKLSPTTSPVKNTKAGMVELSDSDDNSDFETTNVLDFISKARSPRLPVMNIQKNPMETYAMNLKRQILSSPTRQSEENPSIKLDDSDDEEKGIPDLTKDQRLMIKQKFAKRKLENTKKAIFSRFQHLHSSKNPNKLFQELKKANAKQLHELKRENGDAELIEEIEKEEEEMGTLLEREIERVRRIRKKEKLKEKAAQALLTGKMGGSDDDEDGDYHDGLDDAEAVPDSDGDPEESDYGLEDNEEDGDETGLVKRRRRVVLSDDENDSADVTLSPVKKAPVERERRHDDSYMFGGPASGSNPESEDEEEVMHVQSDNTPHSQPTEQFHDFTKEDQETSGSHKLFQNLGPRDSNSQATNVSFADDSLDKSIEVPSFQDIPPTQTSVDSQSILATQADVIPSQLAASTQNDEAYSDDEDDYPAAVSKGRKLVKSHLQPVVENEEEEEEEEKVDEEELKERLAFYEAKIRRKELKARRKRKELERKGMKGMVEGEAEESEDEWKGIGGLDNDESDQANSEDERMIDNTLNLDLNDEEIRKKFMEEYQIKDKKDLEKLMDDIKNHRLTKRARGNGFDIELSDEEDELLMAYRRQKLEEQKQRLMESQKLQKLAKNDRAKAFFASIQDEVLSVALDEDSDEDEQESQSTQEDPKKGDSQATEEDEQESQPKKRILHLEESFVQKKLSFLSRNDEDDYVTIQNLSRRQHGINSDDEVEDIRTLKNRSMMNLFKSATPEVVEDEDNSKKRLIDEVATDDDDDNANESDDGLSQVFKKPSVVSLFRSFRGKGDIQVSSNYFSGVTVNKQYKVATGSEASISYMSRASKKKENKKLDFKSTKALKIEQGLREVKQKNFSSKIFNSNTSFE
ncbi:hypothetical protein C7M61_004917 [Candidozyma pseudohaemuli]|uniref:DNA replication checkpoint mediator MRC1 domain-containing protein n=1 Tax=Candidozyma pseudohaemuli TaxID=418784 RepID=A0A2P7YFJ8_9ASCO|nr:hypothetical protein C7M61_004917 [[Candida] pseudohaemulonii]PSK34724.1 hypothetical protein C7M61_004917 [[Candida] pseudohaemulonii]